MQHSDGSRGWRLRRLVTKRPRLTLLFCGVFLAAAFIAAPRIKSVITSTFWWHVHKRPECAGSDLNIAQGAITATPPTILMKKMATDFDSPTSLASMPNGDILISEKAGLLKIYNPDSDSQRNVTDLTSIVNTSGDNGLINIVMHPDYGTAGEDRIYLFYNQQPDISIVVASAHLTADLTFTPSELSALQIIPHVKKDHSGGAMLFLPDGQLLVSIGDDHKDWNAQNESNLLGKILIVNPDIPQKQPIVIAQGLRNPAHVSLSPSGDTLWISDVGNTCVEEIDRIPFSGAAQVTNFGWPMYEGNFEYKRRDDIEGSATLTMPVTTYAHENGACAVIGGAFLADWYIYADYCDGIIRGLPLDAAAGTKAAQLFDLNSLGKRVGIVSIVGDELGRVWVLEGWSGGIYRLEVAP